MLSNEEGNLIDEDLDNEEIIEGLRHDDGIIGLNKW